MRTLLVKIRLVCRKKKCESRDVDIQRANVMIAMMFVDGSDNANQSMMGREPKTKERGSWRLWVSAELDTRD